MAARSLSTHDIPLVRLALAVAMAACASICLVSSLLLWRRLSGELLGSLGWGSSVGAATAALAAISGLRWTGSNLLNAGESRQLRLALFSLPAIALLVIGVSLSTLTSTAWALVPVWLAIIAEEATWWAILIRGARTPTRTRAAGSSQTGALVESGVARGSGLAMSADLAGGHSPPYQEEEEPLPANVIQQVTRVRESNGVESLHGVLRGTFFPGERTQNLHMAFCPPLSSIPDVSFEQVDGPLATIKVGQVETFGARLEIRLDVAGLEAADVLVEFSAIASPLKV